jgi:DNA ligase-1
MVRRAKTRHPDVEKINYVIYDCVSANKYLDRTNYVSGKFMKNVFFIDMIVVTTMKHIEDAHTHYTEYGYEGIMIRGNGPYKHGRSKDLLKYKKFMDDEFEVVGHHMSKFGTPVFECKCGDNKTFSVMMKEDFETKNKRMDNIYQYYGKKLTVKFQELTSDGIPRFPVGICFRDYE